MLKISFTLLLSLTIPGLIWSQFGDQSLVTGDSLGHFGANEMCTGDFDQNGTLDVVIVSVTTSSGSKIKWHKNTGDEKFDDPILIDFVGGTEDFMDIDTADVDGDGDLDLVYITQLKLKWAENVGGSFDALHLISTGVYSYLSAGDINGDGNLDIACSWDDDDFIWYEGLGGGNFNPTPHSIDNTVLGPKKLVLVDLNGDNNLDCLIARQELPGQPPINRFSWYKNLGSGVFGAETPLYSVFGVGVLLGDHDLNYGDIDGDTDIDLVLRRNDDIIVIKNLGSDVFDTPIVISQPGTFWIEDSKLADLDNDNDLDIVCALSNPKKIFWFENDGTGTFLQEQEIVGQTSFYRISCGDINSDGITDIVSTSQYMVMFVEWHKNLGGANFEGNKIISDQIGSIQKVESFDVNNDGWNDLLVTAGTPGSMSYFLNDNNSSFPYRENVNFSLGNRRYSMLYDIDNDGLQDIVSTGYSTGSQIKYNLNLGTGEFGSDVSIMTFSDGKQFDFVDYTNDGIHDIIFLSNTTNQIYFYNGLGGVNFSTYVSLSSIANNNVSSFLAFDSDADGDIDLFLHSTSGPLYHLKNDGNGNFPTYVNIGTTFGIGIKCMKNYDIDNDGDMDIVCVGDKLKIYLNSGTGTFSVLNINNDDAHYCRLVDINLDGLTDVVTISGTLNQLAWFENVNGTSFGPKTIISTDFNSGSFVNSGDFDNDGDFDLVTISSGDNTISTFENYFYGKTSISGRVYFDIDTNKIYNDSIDIDASYIKVYATPNSDYTFTYLNGTYLKKFTDSVGQYTIQPDLIDGWSIYTDSLVYHIAIDSSFNGLDSLDFGIYPDSLFQATTIDLTGGFPRCNSTVNYWLNLWNVGSQIGNGIVKLELDSNLTFNSSDWTEDSIVNNTIYWHFDSLNYFSNYQFIAQVDFPNYLFMNDTVMSYMTVYSLDSIGNVAFESHDSISQVIVCAYDPNDKIVEPKGIDSLGYIPKTVDYLEYTIRFQNTGNDTAINVKINDQLSSLLDWQSLDFVASSHEVHIEVEQTGLVTFNFLNINLPDSSTNSLGSQGFVKFGVNILPTTNTLATIENNASIYFDFNPPIITNTTLTTLYECQNIFQGLTVFTDVCDTFNLIGGTALPFVYELNLNSNTYQSFQNFSLQLDTLGDFELNLKIAHNLCPQDTTLSISLWPSEFLMPCDTIYVCQNDSVLVFDDYQSAETLYKDTVSYFFGCDTIYQKFIKHNPNYFDSNADTIQICFNDSVFVTDKYLSVQGLYLDTMTSIHGCDSVKSVFLSVYDAVTPGQLPGMIICPGDSAMIFGQYQKVAGTYSNIITNSNGCDSIVNMELVNFPNIPVQNLTDVFICAGDSIMIFDTYKMNSGVYFDTLQSANGCDSIFSQSLIYYPEFGNQNLGQISICEGDSAFIFGQYHTLAGMYFDTLFTVHNCDSILYQNLIVNTNTFSTDYHNVCEPFLWIDGNLYDGNNSSATYVTENLNGCDSVITLNLVISDFSVSTNSDGFSISTPSFGDSYQWIDCDNNYAEISGQNTQLFYPESNGNYAVIVEQNGCSDTSDCVNISALAIFRQDDFKDLNIIPNPSQGLINIDFRKPTWAQIEIYNSQGELIKRVIISDAVSSVEINFEGAPGLYLFKISNEYSVATYKIIKE